jgi:hypothetical protein
MKSGRRSEVFRSRMKLDLPRVAMSEKPGIEVI